MGDPATALALYLALSALLPSGQTDSAKGMGASMVHAVRTTGTIALDGILSENAWSTAQPVTNFTQREPIEGAGATERTEVRILYDDDALYVGARLFDSRPDSVRAQVARRDRVANSDRFVIFLAAILIPHPPTIPIESL